jgi:hypothetical protein
MPEYQPGKTTIARPHIRALALLALLLVVVFSVVSSNYRPTLGYNGKFDGPLAFAVLGALLAIAYRRHPITAMWVIAMAACGLELAQHWSPGRHVHLRNAEIKAMSGVVGLGFTILALEIIHRLRRQ